MTLTQEIFFQIWKLLPNMVVPQTGKGAKAAHANQESIGCIEHHKGNVRPGNRTTCVRVSGAFYAVMVTQYLQRIGFASSPPPPHPTQTIDHAVLRFALITKHTYQLATLSIGHFGKPKTFYFDWFYSFLTVI